MGLVTGRLARRRSWELKSETRNVLKGLAFVSPWLFGFFALILYPMAASLYYSFTEYSLFGAPQWIGLGNYTRLFEDDKFYTSLSNTILFSAMVVPSSIILGIILAVLLNNNLRGNVIYRTIIFVPAVIPAAAAAVIWVWILNPRWGLLNYGLSLINIPGPPWLSNPDWSKPALLIVTLWMIGTDMLLYLAGLQDIPAEYYEAAELDGAGSWGKFRRITLPLISPITFFHTINGFIWSFQYFAIPFIVSDEGQGRPADSLLFYSLYLYRNAFNYLKMGYASAMAWVLFIIVLACTLLILKTSKSWVHYGN